MDELIRPKGWLAFAEINSWLCGSEAAGFLGDVLLQLLCEPIPATVLDIERGLEDMLIFDTR